jgi:TolA-binding protein
MQAPGRLAALGLALAAVLGAPVTAQAQSMEERLRTELRSVTQQLQQLQSERAQLNAAKSTAEAQRDAAQKEIEQLRGQGKQLQQKLEAAQTEAGKLDQVREAAREQVAASQAHAAQVRGAYDELLGMARASEARRNSLETALKASEGLLTMCESKNADMYAAGKELLAAYESFGTGDMLKIRQPFAGKARVLFDEQAQAYGDKLYDAQFIRDARQPPAAAESRPAD